MSLEINPTTISEVLLADGWHIIEEGSFVLDSYEYVEGGGFVCHGGGGEADVCATGFSFLEVLNLHTTVTSEQRTSGPLTAILAVRNWVRDLDPDGEPLSPPTNDPRSN